MAGHSLSSAGIDRARGGLAGSSWRGFPGQPFLCTQGPGREQWPGRLDKRGRRRAKRKTASYGEAGRLCILWGCFRELGGARWVGVVGPTRRDAPDSRMDPPERREADPDALCTSAQRELISVLFF